MTLRMRKGDPDKIQYIWSVKTREHAVLVAITDRLNYKDEVVGVFAARKEARDLHCDPEQFAIENKWYQDLDYEICEQLDNPPFGEFDLETYISIHNTSIRTRA